MIGKTNATVIIGGGSTVIIREYTSSTTWNKPSGLKYLLVVCVGAGGGGGSGRRGAANTNRYGGCAGSGGYMVKRYIKENLLNATESIVIGTGGNGGVSQTNDNTDGVNGSNGGDSSFGTLVVAKASGGGLGGRTSSYASGESVPVTNCVPKYYFTTACCTSPASTNGTPANYGIKPFANPNQGTQGGMVGAGINSSNLVGGMISLPNLVKADNTEQTGTSGGANGADNVCLQLLNEYATVSITKGIGAGGGGGAAGDAAGTIAGGNGGNGGIYGAGGGGGGASTNGANSGAGGNGSNGLVIIMEIY